MFRVQWRLALVALIALACACTGLTPPPAEPPPPPGSPAAEAPGSTGLQLFPGGAEEPGFAPDDALASVHAPFRTEVLTDPGELPVLRVRSDGAKALPLQHTDVKATVAGFTADVTVKQTYSNPYDRLIEATYVFPLPENAAVYSMKMVIDHRVIESVVKEREAARRTYEAARRAGHAAALLEEERPNVFTQSVANIAPGKTIEVILRYVQDMTYDAGEYELVFPMVVGPRYVPGAPLGGAPSGTGTRPDTAAVPDAARITPPVLGKGERSGHDISLEVVASPEGAVSRFEVPTHAVTSERLPGGALRVRLDEKDRIPNRDFVLRYRVAGEEPKAILYATGKGEGHFSLVVQPPALDVERLVGRRELVFVVDVSGSMSGQPLALCQAAMRDALSRMRPVDTFNVITFAGATGKAFARPRPANEAAIREAMAFVDEMEAGGGTEMMNAIRAALSPDVEEGRHRYVFFLTDGQVGNDDQILSATRAFVSAIEAGGQRARVFGFGAGSAVNRALIEGLGRQGKGVSVHATNREDPERAVNRFYRYIDRSVLRDLRIDFGPLGASDVYPAELPDLFASHPVIVHGRWSGSLGGRVVVHATGPSGPVDIPVTVARAPMDDGWPIQDLLWARSRIGWLERDLWAEQRSFVPDEDPSGSSIQEQITALGIAHHLVTRFTSFVAVDTETTVGDGAPAHVVQPVEVPEGVDAAAAGALHRSLLLQNVQGVPASGPGDGYRYEFSDDPLANGGFGPNDATIRVRTGVSSPAADRDRLDMQVVSGPLSGAPAVSRGPRGCNCGLAGERPARGGPALLFVAAALALAGARRRARSRRA